MTMWTTKMTGKCAAQGRTRPAPPCPSPFTTLPAQRYLSLAAKSQPTSEKSNLKWFHRELERCNGSMKGVKLAGVDGEMNICGSQEWRCHGKLEQRLRGADETMSDGWWKWGYVEGCDVACHLYSLPRHTGPASSLACFFPRSTRVRSYRHLMRRFTCGK